MCYCIYDILSNIRDTTPRESFKHQHSNTNTRTQVHVYRFVTENTVEERIVLRAEKKLYLDKMVNRDSTQQAMQYEKLDMKEMLKLLRFGANAVFSSAKSSTFSDKELNQLIRRDKNKFKDEKQRHRADKFEAQTAPLDFRNMAGLNLQNSSKKKTLKDIGNEWIMSKEKRDRKSRIVNVDGFQVRCVLGVLGVLGVGVRSARILIISLKYYTHSNINTRIINITNRYFARP